MSEAGKPRRGAGESHIYNILRRKILDLEFAPSRGLDEAALANMFKISRTPLREAMNRTANELQSIAGAARNPQLARFYERIQDEKARLAGVCFSYEITAHEAQLHQIVDEHREMLEAIGDADAPHAERLGHAHATLFQRRVSEYFSVNDAASVAPVAPGPQ